MRAYAKWLSSKTGRAYHLLSEAEWEYSCRVGGDTPFWWSTSIMPSRANYDGTQVDEGGGWADIQPNVMPRDMSNSPKQDRHLSITNLERAL
jgi:formylglycine-generating enzyme required for sulfatase activity